MTEHTFIARVQIGRRVAIPQLICELLKITEGDIVRIRITKEARQDE